MYIHTIKDSICERRISMKIFKKSLAMLLSILMLFSVLPASVFTASAATNPIEGATGTGTEADPFIVDTFDELYEAFGYVCYQKLYIVANGDIECPEPLGQNQFTTYAITLTVNGTLHSEGTVFFADECNLVLNGSGSLVSENGNCLVVNSGYVTIDGDLTVEAKNGSAVSVSITSTYSQFNINGGTFKGTQSSLLTSGANRVILSGGSFPNGINAGENPNLGDFCAYLYEDGTMSTALRENVPVVIYALSFATQYPAMTEGETSKDLGIRETGAYGVLSIKFTAGSLPQASIDAGYTIKEDLKVYDPTGALIKSQSSGEFCQVVPEIEGVYTIIETLALTNSYGNEIASLSNTFTFTAETRYNVNGRISGVPEGEPITINLYQAGSDTPFKTTTAYGQGDYDINNLPVDVAFEIEGVPNGDYILEAICDGYETVTRSFTVNNQHYVDLIFMESYKVVVVDVTGMYEYDTATIKLYKAGTDTVAHTAKIKGNGSHIFSDVAAGSYTVEVSAAGYKTQKSSITASDEIASAYFDMVLDENYIDFGFAEQYPAVTDYEKEVSFTDMGLVFEAPSFSFTAKQLNFKYLDMGYTIKTRTQVEYSSGGIETFDSTTWTCGNYYDGTNKVTQIVMLLDPDGKEVGRKTHTYTFTYAKLYFETRTPGVTNEQAAAGFSDLGTLTTAPKFAFSAYPLSSSLTKEGYSQTVKMEAYQGDKLVYSADNGNTYIHIYPGEGTVFQTIYLLNADGEVVDSISHAYTFTVEFPEGTIALDADFLTLAENSTHQLSATFAPESLAETLVWTSSNSDVATIDSNGNITAVRPGSVLITATLGNGATAYCTVLVTAEDVKAYVGGIGLSEGEYLAQGSSIPTTVKPADNYAYLSTVNGTLTITLHNYSYSGMGTFTSKNAAYGIYSTQAIKVVSEGYNTIGPMSAPVDKYTSYGIGNGETVSITSDGLSVLHINGVSTAISSTRYVMLSANLGIDNVTSGISCIHGQSMGRINFQSGNININCTGTAITITGNAVYFTGADVTINCKSGINFVRQGEIVIESGSLEMYASASGINVKSGVTMAVNGGTTYIKAANNAVALEGELAVNGGSIVLISTDTASDDSYSAINGEGTLTLASNIDSVSSTDANYSTSAIYADYRRSVLDYVSFRDSKTYTFVKQPVGAAVKGINPITITWETGFKPTKLELLTYNGDSVTTTTLNHYYNYDEFDILPEGSYYQLRAYYATNYYVDSVYFYVSSVPYVITFDSGVEAQKVAYGELAVKPDDPEKDYKFFYGWLMPDGKLYDFSTPIISDVLLTAGWTDVRVDGVAIQNGYYLDMRTRTVTSVRPSDNWAYYEDGVLTLYNYRGNGSGIEFGNIDLTIVSSGDGNSINCITSEYDYANLIIEGTATLTVGHAQWTDYAIQVYSSIIFRCDTVVECIDCTAIADTEAIIVDGAEVEVYAYIDTNSSNTIYGCEASITVVYGSLYLYCNDDNVITDSFVFNTSDVVVYANNNLDGVFTEYDIITKVDEAYDLAEYNQVKIVSLETVRFYVDGTFAFAKDVPYGTCLEEPTETYLLDKIILGWLTEYSEYYDFDTPVTNTINLYAKWTVIDYVHGDFDFENHIISGILPGSTDLEYYNAFTLGDYLWSYHTDNGYLGTGTVANVVNGDEVIESYSILLYGDVNGDGWCDGMDAVIVSCIVNGMISESDIGELAYTAADCNHDGVIDEADVELLNQAGALLASVDQTKSAEELLETSSAYVEYLELIDQTPEAEVEDETDAPEANQEDTTPEQNAKVDIFEMIISFIKSIFEMLIAFIPVPIK